MDTFELECTSAGMLNQQIASIVFSCLPEDGPLAVILDGKGQSWPSDAVRFSNLFSENHCLDDIIAMVDDGADPVISDINGTTVVAYELATSNIHCGYIVFALEGYTQESAVKHIDLVDTILSLINLVGGLIEKANNIQAVQMKNLNYSRYSEVTSYN